MMAHACVEREFANTKWGKQKGVDFFGVINLDTDYNPPSYFFDNSHNSSRKSIFYYHFALYILYMQIVIAQTRCE